VSDMSMAGGYWTKRNRTLQTKKNPGIVSSSDLNKLPSLQDMEGLPIFIGSDVCALYPSLDKIGTAEIAYDVICESDIQFEGIDYSMLIVYLFLILGRKGLLNLGLSEIIPSRKNVKGNPTSLSAMTNRRMENWTFRTDIFENMDTCTKESMKRRMVAAFIKINILVLFESTCYTFGGKLYKQLNGAGIGLRAAAVLAKIVMSWWDSAWASCQDKWGLICQIMFRYIDDIRLYIRPINMSWAWEDTGWVFDPNRIDNRTPHDRTVQEISKSLNSVLDFLDFTMETELDFESKWLPTLDMQTQVQNNGVVQFKFF